MALPPSSGLLRDHGLFGLFGLCGWFQLVRLLAVSAFPLGAVAASSVCRFLRLSHLLLSE